MAAPPRNPRPQSGDVGEFLKDLGIDPSPTVEGVVSGFGARPVTSWEMVEAILRPHTDYAPSLRRPTGESFDQSVAGKRPAYEWVREAVRLLRPDRVKTLHGRVLIVALSRLDPSLERVLTANGFLPTLIREIKEPLEEVFQPPTDAVRQAETTPEQDRGLGPPDQVPLHYDNPTLQDRLGRRGFARSLAIRFERIRLEYQKGEKRGSFIFHLHGPWGSGKTSLLEMLKEELQTSGNGTQPARKPLVAQPWVVVNFNAWQHQRLDPPWWFLLDAVYRQGRDQLQTVLSRPRDAARLRRRELQWRVMMSRLDVIIAGLILLALAGVSAVVLVRLVPRLFTGTLGGYATTAQSIAAILGLAGSIATVVALVARSLLSGSSRAAQQFVQAGADPMERICRHFRGLLGWIDAPVLVVIDDLDRCQPSYVVTLLEGIQTLFSDSRVIYVLSGDRRWLYACFEKTYEPFAASVQEPGRRLGSLFLEKAVQLSVPVPRLSADVQKAYWQYLLGKDPVRAGEEAARAEAEIRQEFEDARTEGQAVARVESPQERNPVRQQIRRQVAIEHLASAPLEASTLYFLEPFAPLLEPNPRAMKRLLNDYSMQRDQAILAGHDLADHQRRTQLALWTIVCMRWPALEEYFISSVADQPRDLPPELDDLVNSSVVKRVLDGECVGTQLNGDAIRWLAGLRAPEGASGSAA